MALRSWGCDGSLITADTSCGQTASRGRAGSSASGHNMTLPIVAERLILRRYAPSDIQDVVELVSHPSVARATPEIEATGETHHQEMHFT